MARVRHTAFDTAHPAVPVLYLAITLVLSMAAMQPVLIVLSLVGAFAYGCCVRGIGACLRALRWQLPIILVIAVFNPLFSASGSTELFRLGGRAIYLESLCYGCAMGGLFVASMLWFQAAAELLSFDKVMALFGNAAPIIALMISMTMRLVPRFLRQGRQIAAVQGVVASSAIAGAADGRRGGLSDAFSSRLRLSSVLMGWSMEDSLETADAMRARGWGATPRRTPYTRFRFSSVDAAACAALAAGGVLCAVLAWAATSQFSFYPTMSRLVAWWGYVPYAAWMLLPAVLHVREDRRFR